MKNVWLVYENRMQQLSLDPKINKAELRQNRIGF